MSRCSVDKPNALLTALKNAEDGKGVIMRLVETLGKPKHTKFRNRKP
jgi:alpha-mannosidase